jgi:hypothetical protein
VRFWGQPCRLFFNRQGLGLAASRAPAKTLRATVHQARRERDRSAATGGATRAAVSDTIGPERATCRATQSDGEMRLVGRFGRTQTPGRIISLMTSIRRRPAVYCTMPLQQRTSSPATTDDSHSLSAVGDRTVDEVTTDRVCAPWCADRANHPDKVAIQATTRGSVRCPCRRRTLNFSRDGTCRFLCEQPDRVDIGEGAARRGPASSLWC